MNGVLAALALAASAFTLADAVILQSGSDSDSDTESKRVVQRLANYKGIEYSTNVSVGGQVLRAILDTGSFELLVISEGCKSFDCQRNKRRFKPKRSPTFRSMPWSKQFSYGSGDATCKLARDTVKVGSLTFPEQAFWEATDAEMSILRDGTFEAIIGVGNPQAPFQEMNDIIEEDRKLMAKCKSSCPRWMKTQTADDIGFWDMSKANPSLVRNMRLRFFSACYLRDPLDPGFWTWNDYNPSENAELFGSAAVTAVREWKVGLGDVRLVSNTRSQSRKIGCGDNERCAALFDTGTSLLMAPSNIVRQLVATLDELPGRCDNFTSMPYLTFKLDDADVILPPSAYIGKVHGSVPDSYKEFLPHIAKRDASGQKVGTCNVLMLAADEVSEDGLPLLILGMPFFRYYYTTFDNGDPADDDVSKARKVYFAPADRTCVHPTERGGRSLQVGDVRFFRHELRRGLHRAVHGDVEDLRAAEDNEVPDRLHDVDLSALRIPARLRRRPDGRAPERRAFYEPAEEPLAG